MYGIYKMHQARRKNSDEEGAVEQHHEKLQEIIDSVLKQHYEEVVVAAPKKKASSPLFVVLRRDSYSTITTADETPEARNSLIIMNTTMESSHQQSSTSVKNNGFIPREIRFQKEETVGPPPKEMPLIQKAQKFLPDPMNVVDIYNDDEEEIVFVPDNLSSDSSDTIKEQLRPSSYYQDIKHHDHSRAAPEAAAKDDVTATKEENKKSGRPILRRGTSVGLEKIPAPPERRAAFHVIRIEI